MYLYVYFNMDNKTIKKILEEKRRNRKKVTLSLDGERYDELKRLSKIQKLPISYLIDASIEIALADPYINPKNPKEIEGDDFD